METKVLTAEISFSQSNAPLNMEDIDAELQRVDSALEQFANKADKTDYAVALACGILSGVLDALFTGEFSLEQAKLWGDDKVCKFYEKAAQLHGYKAKKEADSAEKVLEFLEKHTGEKAPKIKFGKAADLNWDPSLRGLFFCILTQFTGKTYFEEKDGVHSEEVKNKKLIGDDAAQRLFFGIMLWFFHLVHHISFLEKKGTEDINLPGIPKQICSVARLLSMIPYFKDSTPEQIMVRSTDLVTKFLQKFNMGPAIGIIKEIGKQAFPVLLNEVCVRCFYAMRRLTEKFSENQIADISDLDRFDWNDLFPVTNRTLTRMLMVSHMTSVTVDVADAAMRAYVESEGEAVLFLSHFAARVNYVGAGRALIEVVRDNSYGKKETELLHKKALLMEKKAEIMLQQLQAFKEQLQEKLSDFLAEDIEAYLEGFDDIQKGFLQGSSDLVIRGNVKIQKTLGREAQFTNQKEFDDLMDSDIALQL